MRIFSIHKSKSKKQVSEKTPKLAANKFLEKRKVGTVIYLHEHPSGKIHGPYRKEYDKKIMKGGFNLTCEHFKILGNPQLLEGTTQLIIKEERISSWHHRILREPLLFFGDSTFMQDNIPSYTYALFNSYGIDIENKNEFVKKTLTCYKVVPLNSQYRLQKVQISEIEDNILLGLYYQYIERCKQEFPSLKISRDVQYYNRLYMKRLFLYLLLYVLPKLNLYFSNIIHNNQDKTKEKKYYTNIVDYVTNIDIDRLLSIFITSYDMPQQFKDQIMEEYLKSQQSNANANENENENMVENAMRLSVSSQDIESRLEQPQQLQQSSSGSGAVNLFEVIPLLPILIPAAIIGIPIGIVIYGTMHLAKQIAKMIKKNKKRN